ncbi:MAG TPA: crosslink repair DNA glycosylase YcaQ family protein [Vicinamibacterales bacterium]|nr:crosslink repair DNA glycosylase YcaQ family protein [Vicinamibacterales bacterium]
MTAKLKFTWTQALAWRQRRHFLDPIADHAVEEVVTRLCGVQAQVASSADLAVRLRQKRSRPGEVAKALADGGLIKTWGMRGTLHLFTPGEAGNFLSLIAASRSWERPVWERYFGVSPAQMHALRAITREILGTDPLTREELIAQITRHRGFEHLGEAMKSGWGTVFKPLAWQGDICFGPSRGQRITFTTPQAASSAWAGVPAPDDAWPKVIDAYLGAYGPATIDNFSAWLSRGTVGKRELGARFDTMGDAIREVEVDGQVRLVRSTDVDDLIATEPRPTVRLLAGFDQWVLGPGTDDPNVVPAAHRTKISRTAGWIAPGVLVGGVVRGTWTVGPAKSIEIHWFPGIKKLPAAKAVEAELARVLPLAVRS